MILALGLLLSVAQAQTPPVSEVSSSEDAPSIDVRLDAAGHTVVVKPVHIPGDVAEPELQVLLGRQDLAPPEVPEEVEHFVHRIEASVETAPF